MVHERLGEVRKRGDPRHVHELLSHFPKVGGAPGMQVWEIQVGGQRLGGGREEIVPWDAELRGDVEHDAAEEVDDEDGRGGAGEEATEVWDGEAGDLVGDRLGEVGVERRDLDLREAVEGDGGVGSGGRVPHAWWWCVWRRQSPCIEWYTRRRKRGLCSGHARLRRLASSAFSGIDVVVDVACMFGLGLDVVDDFVGLPDVRGVCLVGVEEEEEWMDV